MLISPYEHSLFKMAKLQTILKPSPFQRLNLLVVPRCQNSSVQLHAGKSICESVIQRIAETTEICQEKEEREEMYKNEKQ